MYAPSSVFWVCANFVAGLAALGAFLTAFFWCLRRRLIFVAPLTVEAAGGYVLPVHLQPSIVTIATNGFSAEELVQTVRKQGNFKGDVFVLGDACTPTSQRATYLQAPSKAPPKEDKNVTPAKSSEGTSAPASLLSEDAPRQAAKHLKQKIFRTLDHQLVTAGTASPSGVVRSGAYVGRPAKGFVSGHAASFNASFFSPSGPQRILYLDADITVNAPLAPLLSAMGSWDPACSAYLFRERW